MIAIREFCFFYKILLEKFFKLTCGHSEGRRGEDELRE